MHIPRKILNANLDTRMNALGSGMTGAVAKRNIVHHRLGGLSAQL
jgi:hypothetical protein